MKNLRLPPSHRDRSAVASFVCLTAALFFCSPLSAQKLECEANAPLDSVTSYRIYYGYAPGDRQFFLNVGTVTDYRFAPAFTRNTYFALTALNINGESGYSNEAAFIVDSTATRNICDCDGNGKVEKLDYAKLRLLIGNKKFLSDGTLNPKYHENYDLNQDQKIDGLDRVFHKKLCP